MNKIYEKLPFDIIKQENKIILAKYFSELVIIIKDPEKENFPNFKNIKLEYLKIEPEENKPEDLVIKSLDEKIIYSIFELLLCGCKPIEALLFLKDNLETKPSELLKFYGDLAESIFILQSGATKIFDGESADVILGDCLYEIKSFSFNKKTIKINYKQLKANTKKIAVEIIPDNDGQSIIEISSKLLDSEFSIYLQNKYLNTQFSNIKYNISKYFELKNLPFLELPNDIIRAEFEILISNYKK